MVLIGALRLITAICSVLRGGARPRLAFWLFSAHGACVMAGCASYQGINAEPIGNTLIAIAVITCGFGYAGGARLTPKLGGWQVIPGRS
jgi:drug/metabolite transporter (DMT)-like permease